MSWGSLPLPDALAFCRNIWAMLDPQGVGQFAVLDMHLLRRTLIMLSRRAKVAGNAYRTQASTSVDVVLGSEDSAIQELYRGFLLTSGGGSPLLQEAASNSMSSPRHHLQVMARASLLLRLATGAAQRLLRDAGVRPTDIDFWISGLAEANGLWSTPADRPRQLTDLYEDVMTALDEIQNSRRIRRSRGQASVCLVAPDQVVYPHLRGDGACPCLGLLNLSPCGEPCRCKIFEILVRFRSSKELVWS